MDKLLLRPTYFGYSVTPPPGAIRADGIAGLYGADIPDGVSYVDVQFDLNAVRYQYFWAFFRIKALRGTARWLTDLMLESSAIAEYSAQFIPGSLRLASCDHFNFQISAQLEIVPTDPDDSADQAVIDTFEASIGV